MKKNEEKDDTEFDTIRNKKKALERKCEEKSGSLKIS